MTNDISPKECRAFQWIGQSIATCDNCGKPIFDHDGDSHPYGGPFSRTSLLKPFDEAVIANWIINEWINRERAAYLLSVTEQIITNDIVTQSQQHGTQHDNTGTDEEYIQHLELKLHKTNDEIERLRNALAEQTIIHEVQKTNTLSEIERLRKDKRELLEITRLFADNGQCVIANEFGDCLHIDGVCEWHDTEHLWQSFCMARGI